MWEDLDERKSEYSHQVLIPVCNFHWEDNPNPIITICRVEDDFATDLLPDINYLIAFKNGFLKFTHDEDLDEIKRAACEILEQMLAEEATVFNDKIESRHDELERVVAELV